MAFRKRGSTMYGFLPVNYYIAYSRAKNISKLVESRILPSFAYKFEN